MNRREFLKRLAAGGVVTAAGLWMPGEKLISIPSRKIFVPKSYLAWLEGPIACLYRIGGEIQRIDTRHFDVPIVGAEFVRGRPVERRIELQDGTLHMV
jgi:hypothetical protein